MIKKAPFPFEVAFFGGSFNPPTIAHKKIVEYLIQQSGFEKVIVKPCGFRRDKPELGEDQSRKLRVVEELSFDQEHYSLDLTGMDEAMKPTWFELDEMKIQLETDHVWLVVGTDLFIKEPWGGCQVQRWVEGERLFHDSLFYVFPRPTRGEIIWPPNYYFVENFEMMDVSSTQLRKQENRGLES